MKQAMGPEVTGQVGWQQICRWLPSHWTSGTGPSERGHSGAPEEVSGEPCWEWWGGRPSPPRPFSGLHGSGAAALRPLGTHRLLVPARLAGVLEGCKLAVPSGPAVLIDDALLGGQGAALSGKAGQQAHHALGGAEPYLAPSLSSVGPGADAPQRPPPLPSGSLAHSARLGVCSPGCLRVSLPSHTTADGTETQRSRWT